MVRNLGKHQRSKQRCHDLGWKAHDRNKSFVHELRNQHVSIQWLVPQYGVNNYRALCTVKAKKANKNLQPSVATTKNFVVFHNHSTLLTIFKLKFITSILYFYNLPSYFSSSVVAKFQ